MAGENAQAQNDQWSVDFSGWKRKDLKAFNAAANSGEDDAVLPYYVGIVKKWPYPDLDPAKVESYDELPIEGWAEVNRRVADALKSRMG